MHTHAVVMIDASQTDIRSYAAFERAAEFTRYPCHITIRVRDTGQEISASCTPEAATCWGWRYFKDCWEQRFGRIA